MHRSKVFVAIEAADRPPGAMLVRYQAVETVEPDAEEAKLADAQVGEALASLDVPKDQLAEVRTHLQAAKAMFGANRTEYRLVDRIVICATAEEVSGVIAEAREAYDEIHRLSKAGARVSPSSGGLLV